MKNKPSIQIAYVDLNEFGVLGKKITALTKEYKTKKTNSKSEEEKYSALIKEIFDNEELEFGWKLLLIETLIWNNKNYIDTYLPEGHGY